MLKLKVIQYEQKSKGLRECFSFPQATVNVYDFRKDKL